jgi:hypothetical protein
VPSVSPSIPAFHPVRPTVDEHITVAFVGGETRAPGAPIFFFCLFPATGLYCPGEFARVFQAEPKTGAILSEHSPRFFYPRSAKETYTMKIYVGNIPFSMDESGLRALFSEFGEIDSLNVIMDRDTGRPRGFAFVEMPDGDAKQAIGALHEREVDGRKLNVNEARAR